MAITAADVNKLRGMTGAGMMDCKKALDEAGGDFDQAVDLLRKKGQKVSASRSDREAREGAVIARLSADNKTGVLLELNCETDFVARNDDFQALGGTFAELALAAGATELDAVKALNLDGRPIADHLTDAMGRIGEKIDISKYQLLSAEAVYAYIHPGARVGVLVAFEGVAGVDLNVAGKDVAMQIASMNPIALDKSGVDPTVIEREIEIGKEQARAEGKPEAMLEKIATGRLDKFYKERVLLAQEFVKDSSINIAEYLKKASPSLKVVAFRRFHLG